MKKQYISPEIITQTVELQQIICQSVSISSIGGTAGISLGDETEATSGDSRRGRWDEEDEWDDEDW